MPDASDLDDVVQDYVFATMPERIRTLRRLALADLYLGPGLAAAEAPDEWPGR